MYVYVHIRRLVKLHIRVHTVIIKHLWLRNNNKDKQQLFKKETKHEEKNHQLSTDNCNVVYECATIYVKGRCARSCYDGSKISFDCWNLGKAIIWTKGSIVHNYTKGTYAKMDASCGLGDWGDMKLLHQHRIAMVILRI